MSKNLKNEYNLATLPSCSNFQKFEFSVAHETHFKHAFKIREANSTFVA